MEGEWPKFDRRDDGAVILTGIYGTRAVDYLTLWHFDEFDRMPEVMAAHLQFAMQQLWLRDA